MNTKFVSKAQKTKERSDELSKIINSDFARTLEYTTKSRASKKSYSVKNTAGFVAQCLNRNFVPVLILPYSTFRNEKLSLKGAKGLMGWVPIKTTEYNYPGIQGQHTTYNLQKLCDMKNIPFEYGKLENKSQTLKGYNIEATFFDVSQSPDWKEMSLDQQNALIDKYTQQPKLVNLHKETQLYEHLKDYVTQQGLKVVESSSNVNTGENGYVCDSNISVFRDIPSSEKLLVLIHEYTHHLLADTDYHKDYLNQRDLAETITQTTTHLVLQDLTTDQATLDTSIKYIYDYSSSIVYDDEVARAFNDINKVVNTFEKIFDKFLDLDVETALKQPPLLSAEDHFSTQQTNVEPSSIEM